MDDRIVASPEAEEAVLGGLLIDPDSIFRVEALRPEDFQTEKHAWIYAAILTLHGRRDAVDFLTVCDELEQRGKLDGVGGPAFITTLINAVPTSIHVAHYAGIVEREAIRRRYMEAGANITRKAFQCQDSNEVAAYANAQLLKLEQNRNGSAESVSQIASAFYDRLEGWAKNPLSDNEVRGLNTGFDSVNRLIEGYKPGDLWIVCGRPGMGKSAFCFESARRVAAKGGKVLIFSLEMTKAAVFERWVAALSGVEARVFRRGHGNIPACMKAIIDLNEITMLWIDDQPGLSPSQVRARATRRAWREGGLDLVVVDHVRKMQLDGRGENTAKTEGRKTAAMKDLAKELGCPVLLAAQLNRGVEGRGEKRPSLGDLRDSGEHEEEADGVLGLYRDEYYNKNTETPHILEILALKQREGPSGASRAELYYDARVQSFREAEFIRKSVEEVL